MSNPGTLSAALAFVPSWWQETTDPAALDALIVAWCRACGWRACGFVWQNENAQKVVRTVHGGLLTEAQAPLEVPDAVRRIRAGEPTVLYSAAGSTGRVFAGVQPPGQSLGLVWAERAAGQPWTETERAYLVLTAKTMERSPAVAAVIGLILDPDRLYLPHSATPAIIAGRMAHDFDNILTGIIGFSDLALPLLQPGFASRKLHRREIGKVRAAGHPVHAAVASTGAVAAPGEAESDLGRGRAGKGRSSPSRSAPRRTRASRRNCRRGSPPSRLRRDRFRAC